MEIKATQVCPVHNEAHSFEFDQGAYGLTEKDVERDIADWKAGKSYIQGMVYFTAAQREQLLTGMCSEAWDSMFPEEECEDDCDGTVHPGLMCK